MRIKSFNRTDFSKDTRSYNAFLRNKELAHTFLTGELGFSRQRATELLRNTTNLYGRIIENYFDVNCSDLNIKNINKVKYIHSMFDLPFKQLRQVVEIVNSNDSVQAEPIEEDYKAYYSEEEEKDLKEWFDLAETLNDLYKRGLIGNAVAIANGLKNRIFVNPNSSEAPFTVK